MDENRTEYREAANEMLRGFEYMVDQATQGTTKIYDGYVQKVNENGTCDITINGQTHQIKQFGTGAVQFGAGVKVFVPQGNMNLAWFMTSTSGSKDDDDDYDFTTKNFELIPLTLVGSPNSFPPHGEKDIIDINFEKPIELANIDELEATFVLYSAAYVGFDRDISYDSFEALLKFDDGDISLPVFKFTSLSALPYSGFPNSMYRKIILLKTKNGFVPMYASYGSSPQYNETTTTYEVVTKPYCGLTSITYTLIPENKKIVGIKIKRSNNTLETQTYGMTASIKPKKYVGSGD